MIEAAETLAPGCPLRRESDRRPAAELINSPIWRWSRHFLFELVQAGLL